MVGWLRQLVNHITYYTLQGLDVAARLLRVQSRVPGITPQQVAQAEPLAQQAIANAQAANLLGVNDPLGNVLGGQQPPGNTAVVYATFEFTDQSGNTVYRTVRTEYGWDETWGDILADMASRAQDMGSVYNWSLQDITAQPPLI